MADAAPESDRATARASTNPLVRLEGLCKAFNDLTVLDDLTLDIEPHKTTVILGPSGSGKSVLLKHIVGLLRPDGGKVYFEGERIDDLRDHKLDPVRRRIGFLFQLSALFDSMTIEENLAFPLAQHTNQSKRERRERVARALDLVDLQGTQKKLPAQLSGGQQKRAALARAIFLEPDLILYDEPTTGLDPIRAAEIDDLINKLKRELNVTSIVVTHDLASANHVADRIVLLYNGKLIADAWPAALHASDDPRVQSFLSGDPSLMTQPAQPDAPGGQPNQRNARPGRSEQPQRSSA